MTWRLFLGTACVLLASCGGQARPDLVPPPDMDDPAARATHLAPALDGYRAAFLLYWKGQRVGEAEERLYATDDAEGGYRFERTERVVVKRGVAVSENRTRIVVDLDVTLYPRRLLVERRNGGELSHGQALRRLDQSWEVVYNGAPARTVEPDAVPSTLVPILVAAGGTFSGRAFEGPVLVEGAGLARARLAVDIKDDQRVALASLTTAAGRLRGRAELDHRGYVVAGGDPSGLSSQRVEPPRLREPFDPPEIVESSAVPLGGTIDDGALKIRVAGVSHPVPRLPEVPGQRVEKDSDGSWTVAVAEPGRIPRGFGPVRAETLRVSRALADDLAAFFLSPEEALAAGRGDCTAHALVLHKALTEAGYRARLVTGFIVDDGALRRHRWVVVSVDDEWVPVDPMYEEAPASPRRLALAVHGPTPDELAFVDDIAFSGWESARACWGTAFPC